MMKVSTRNTINLIKNDPVVQDWIDGLSQQGEISYLRALAEFTQIIKLQPSKMLETAYKEQEQNILPWNRSVEKWLKEYKKHLESPELDRSKTTINLRMSIIRIFFHQHQITTLKPSKKRRNTKSTVKLKNRRKGLTKEKLKQALSCCRKLRLQAIILTQISSGLTAADVVKLKIKDFEEGLIEIDDTYGICMFHFDRQKTEKEFTTLISFEAVEKIKEYLKHERSDYNLEDPLFANHKKGKENKPLTEANIQDTLRYMNTTLQGEQKVKGIYNDITSHMFRKFFNTQLIYAGMPEEIREHMMAHVLVNKTRDAYYIENPDKLIPVYLKYMEHLTIVDSKLITLESPEVRRIIEKQEKDMDNLREEVYGELGWIIEGMREDLEFRKAGENYYKENVRKKKEN